MSVRLNGNGVVSYEPLVEASSTRKCPAVPPTYNRSLMAAC